MAARCRDRSRDSDLGDLGNRITVAFDVNASGVVVGGSEEPPSASDPARTRPVIATASLTPCGRSGGFARGSTTAAGSRDSVMPPMAPFIRWCGVRTAPVQSATWGPWAGPSDGSNTITEDGRVVGPQGETRARCGHGDGRLRTLRPLLPSLTEGGANYAVDLNARGLIVGNGTDAAGFNHATIWRNGANSRHQPLFPA